MAPAIQLLLIEHVFFRFNYPIVVRSTLSNMHEHYYTIVVVQYNGTVRPLSDEEVAKLEKKRPTLIKKIDMESGLTDLLWSRGAITEIHRDHIRSYRTDREKIGEMMNILIRRSYEDLNTFVNCLLETNQSHIANYITGDGG